MIALLRVNFGEQFHRSAAGRVRNSLDLVARGASVEQLGCDEFRARYFGLLKNMSLLCEIFAHQFA
jgi:hypothetical protein